MNVGRKKELGRQVLRDVSRSFYLTLRWLPAGMREGASVGYLLARASDTIADCGGERPRRIALLDEFQRAVSGEASSDFRGLQTLADDPSLSAGEMVLMSRLPEVFAWFGSLDDDRKNSVRKVVATIIAGQRWDLDRFPEGSLTALADPEETLCYCYQVAGSVGEFWTELGFLADPRFASRPPEEMAALGRAYGEGLQLVNILRDRGEDRRRGRDYLPGERADWFDRARRDLHDGLTYARAVRSWRARVATVLPALIGLATLDLLETNSELEKVKVSRKEVKRCLLRAVWFR